MGRKGFTYKYVKEQIEKEGHKLLSTEYINSKEKLRLQCPKGHIYKINWGNFHQGGRCKKCFFNSQKITYKYIKEYIKKERYILLSTEYINNKTKLKIQCSKGHIFYMTWACFNKGQRCNKCFFESEKLDYKYIKKYIESFKYKLLSKTYNKSFSKIKVKCDKGHIYKVTWNHFQQGYRCPECYNKFGYKNYTIEELNKLENYRQRIKKLSEKNYYRYFYTINPKNLKRGSYKYHLDHIYSVVNGFKNNIPIEIISNPNNLQILWWKNNLSKHSNSEQTKQELYLGYYKFILT